MDTNHRIMYWNKALELLTGARGEQLINTTGAWKVYYDKPHPTLADLVLDKKTENLGSFYEVHDKSKLVEGGLHAEKWFKNLNGQDRYLFIDASPIKDKDGNVMAVMETMQDISECKKAQEIVSLREHELETILDSVPALVFYKDKKNHFLRINQTCSDLIGIPKKDIIGKSVSDIFPMSAEKFWKSDKQVIDSGIPLRNVVEEIKEKNAIIQIDKIPYMDDKGEIIGVIGFGINVTEHLKIERALRESEARYRLLAENSNDVIWILDLNRRFTYFSPAVMQHRGYTPEEAVKLSLEETLTPASVAVAHEAFNRAADELRRGQIPKKVLLELEHIRKDGSTFWCEANCSMMFNAAGEIIGFMGITHDISGRKKAEEELRAAYNKLKETQSQLIQAEKMEAIGKIAGGIAHEVKNPLAIALQGINFMETKIPTDQKELHEIFELLKKNIQRSDNIIRALLDFSKATELKLQPEDINSIVESALLLVQYKVKMEHVEVYKELGEGLPKVSVDKSKIEQVFLNLFLNSIQAMLKGGKIFVRSRLVKFT
ncbi:MAG TPA: PAS domain S-box protein, partial [Candidatus Omnitrophota bacterium]|nr:PAS domain S-box protein [Candidatus Omnitrophota bacterium]